MTVNVRTGAARPGAAKAGAALGWPMAEFPIQTMDEWASTQFKLLADATQVGQELMSIASSGMHVGIGVMQRMMAARTPNELVACERDLLELVTSKYFEQVMRIAERMQSTFTPAAAKAAKHVEDVAAMQKAA